MAQKLSEIDDMNSDSLSDVHYGFNLCIIDTTIGFFSPELVISGTSITSIIDTQHGRRALSYTWQFCPLSELRLDTFAKFSAFLAHHVPSKQEPKGGRGSGWG